jgi:hypothetical protein
MSACGAILVLTGCAAHRSLSVAAPRLSALRQQASHGYHQAEEVLMSMISGHGVQVLMTRRAGTNEA